jgi:lysophospholipid acyltransferase (LPLAT)-like uncharacterized protein
MKQIVWFIIRLLVSTYRLEVRGKDLQLKAKNMVPGIGYVFAVWHEQVLAAMVGHAWKEPYLTLASRSKDGDYAAYVAEKMGFVAVRGSSKKRNVDKGGKEALLKYVKGLKEGVSGGLTVDGPKGPRQVCKPGIVLMAQLSGGPIVPVVGVAKSYWEFNSWDRFKIPKPFSRIVVQYGEPILVERDASEERINEVCLLVSERMKELTAQVQF